MINKNEKCNNHYRKYYCAVSSFKFARRKRIHSKNILFIFIKQIFLLLGS